MGNLCKNKKMRWRTWTYLRRHLQPFLRSVPRKSLKLSNSAK